MKKKTYIIPTMTAVEIRAERGYAESVNGVPPAGLIELFYGSGSGETESFNYPHQVARQRKDAYGQQYREDGPQQQDGSKNHQQIRRKFLFFRHCLPPLAVAGKEGLPFWHVPHPLQPPHGVAPLVDGFGARDGYLLHLHLDGFRKAFAADMGGEHQARAPLRAVQAEALAAANFEGYDAGFVSVVYGEVHTFGTGTIPAHFHDFAFGDRRAVGCECHSFHILPSINFRANTMPR